MRRRFWKTLSSFSCRAQQISAASLQVLLSRRMHRTRNTPPLPEKHLSRAESLIKNHRSTSITTDTVYNSMHITRKKYANGPNTWHASKGVLAVDGSRGESEKR